ncbi:Alpha/beta hydrolase fold-1 [Xylariales sp. PMI_506]|nr:Alpha/beta hydrolase fold-1 [Xylariales sp. PMI_506]
MSKPAVVIVPGAWQKPVFFDDLVLRLTDAGYLTKHVSLPTVGGTEKPLAGLADDVAAVQSVLEELKQQGRRALIVGHSSGGLVASNAVVGFESDVDGIIFLSAFMIPKGKALLDLLGGQPLPWMQLQGDIVVGDAALIPQVAFNDLSADDQAKWLKEMTHTSAAMFATPTDFEPWAFGIPCGYIFCSQDNALPLPIQQQMASQLGPDAITVTLDASHCPHLSMPGKLVQGIQEVHSRL